MTERGATKGAAGYVRISQVGARAGDSFHSPEIQRERIEAWAAYRGFEIVEWYVDLDRPAKEGDPRPEFERLMTDAAAGRFSMVAVFRLSRFARSVTDAARRYSELRQLGVGLASVTEDFDTSTASGELIQNMLFALAEFDSRRIGEEWAGVHARRRRQGIAHVTRRMFGYEVENGTLASVVPEEAEAVRRMFEMRARGASYRELADMLEREGQRPRGGGRRFGLTGIAHMLRNPLYAGLVRDGDELLPGRHQPIVAEETWRAVQALHGTARTMSRHRVGLLSGLLVCASCGYRMAHNAAHGRQKDRYRCTGSQHARGCPRPVAILRELVEPHVEGRMLRRLDPARMPHGGKLRRRPAEKLRQTAAAAERRVAELNEALDRLADERYVAGTMKAAEHERQLERLLEEREAARGHAEEAAARAASVTTMGDLDALDFYRLTDLRGKQKLLRTQVERVVIHPHVPGAPLHERVEVHWLY